MRISIEGLRLDEVDGVVYVTILIADKWVRLIASTDDCKSYRDKALRDRIRAEANCDPITTG